MTEHFDVIIIGAGISGIGAACHLRAKCPEKSIAILESRDAIGGTWDLFRYPGIRSDSDMYTLGFSFKPWEDNKALADGPSILRYLHETAREHGVDSLIRFGHAVTRASWSSADSRWTIEAKRGGENVRLTSNFLFSCTGYYDYAQGYLPEFAGKESFRGRVIHPQHWPEDVSWEGKRVIVIGSGATAVTLVPELAKKAANVVMLQRSPTYVLSLPAEDAIANWLRQRLPPRVAYGISRWKNVLLARVFFELARRRPELAKRRILALIKEQLGADYDISTHFTPSYDVWDQRVCFVPDNDLFQAIKDEKVTMVTDRIETFTERGIRTESGRELEADIIVTATGLKLQFMGNIELVVDGRQLTAPETMVYKGMMLRDVPNFAFAIGYTNASWTLKVDLTAEYVCRLLNHMSETGATQCTPRLSDPSMALEPLIAFSSGYVQRALPFFPKQGDRRPWKLYQNYLLDVFMLRLGDLEDGEMEFGRAEKKVSARRPALRTAVH